MSVIYCQICAENVDTDFDAEHKHEHSQATSLVVNLETAKRLKAAEFPLIPYLGWFASHDLPANAPEYYEPAYYLGETQSGYYFAIAPTAQEIGRFLPVSTRITGVGNDQWIALARGENATGSMVEAMALLWLKLHGKDSHES